MENQGGMIHPTNVSNKIYLVDISTLLTKLIHSIPFESQSISWSEIKKTNDFQISWA